MKKNDLQIINCLLALCNWHDVAPKSVNLGTWVCRTQACFGGHLATWPEFQDLGVLTTSYAAPAMQMPYGFLCTPSHVSDHLFGTMSIFNSRTVCDGRGSDHRVIVNRLENQIAALSQ